MSGKENIISDLHTKKGTWKIAIRITDLWCVKKNNGKEAIEMVWLDETGTKIGANLWQELFPDFQEKLHYGSAYVVQNIKVVDNTSDYKVSKVPFTVYLVKTTSVKKVDRPDIPANVHHITQFTDIISGNAPRDTLVDIVGVVVDVIEQKTVNPTFRVTVKLRDNSDAAIIVTVWEEYAAQLGDAIDKNRIDKKPLMVMLTLAKIKDPKDKYPLSVQNIKNGSKLYINSDEPEIRAFRDG